MLTISKPLSAGQTRTYHQREFVSQEQNYWSQNQQGHSEWQGKLAQQWGLQGEVGSEHFARLTEGQHPLTQARIGNVRAPEMTGKFVAATFEHSTARPVEGYAAPQLHTHAVVFNVTERDSGQTRSIQSHELYASQHYATSIYRAELASRLQQLGYELERGQYGQPEIKGYTKEYLEASSLRREQIKDHLREQGLDGAGAAQIAAHHTRDRKAPVARRGVAAAPRAGSPAWASGGSRRRAGQGKRPSASTGA